MSSVGIFEENRRLKTRVAELEEQITHLKRELKLDFDFQQLSVLQKNLKLSKLEATVLIALFARSERYTQKHILVALKEEAGDREGSSEHLIDVMIYHIRKKIGHSCIESIYGQGYRLTPVGVTLVRAALAVDPHA